MATSSTEAKFYTAVVCAKVVRYLCHVLKDLGLEMKDPTPLYVDNQVCIHIINTRRPTSRTRHIEVQFFAVQSWRKNGEIVMRHIPGVINGSDDLTKAVSWVLHHRHARRSMGHYNHVLSK